MGKNSYYLENADDLKKGNEARRQAKSLVRAVLTNDELINEYFKGHYFTYEDYLSLRETMGLAGIEARKNVLEHLQKMVRYKNSAPGLLDLVITVMTDKGSSLPEGKRQAALYFAMSMSDGVNI